MLKLLSVCLMLSSAFAANLGVVSKPYNFQDAPEYQTILSELKLQGEFSAKSTEEVTPPAPKTMSRGEQVVAEAKARNKALIAAQDKAEKEKVETTDSSMSELDKLKLEDQKTRDGWKKEVIETRKQWQKEVDIFLGRIKVYQENTFEIPAPKVVIVEKKNIPNLPEVHIVNGAFNVPIRDQFARPTCSAFAGIRALEIILSQNAVNRDLSEQYFYWASKPECQSSPCDKKGSWVNTAYKYSQKQPQIDIPVEADCAYETGSKERNETQIPLSTKCNVGAVKVESFEEVKTLSDTIDQLKRNVPVIMAAKLSENFYKNSGLVTLSDSTKSYGLGMDGHALGHAFLGVGIMELPAKMKATEGSFCIIIANSWGKGWGAGGYACLTEKWLAKFRQPASFVAVTKVSSK